MTDRTPEREVFDDLLQTSFGWLRSWYGASWLVAVSEHWEEHEPLQTLMDTVEVCEWRYAR
jgi:hypothetical protein